MPSRAVILVNLGTTRAPEPEAVRAFLDEFLSDPMVVDYPGWFWKPVLRGIILRSRPHRVAKLYESIWTTEGSPLDVETRAMAREVQTQLGDAIGVRYAYRYGEPSVRDELRRAREERCDEILVVPLFPQRTGSTTGTIERLVRDVASELDVRDRVRIEYVAPDDSGYIAAQAARWREVLTDDRPPDHVVISFHGIPRRYDRNEGSMYRRDCEATHHALLRRVDWPEDRATLAYQSKFGPEPWIGPTTADVIESLGREGTEAIAVATPGFLTEGLETVEEIGIQNRERFFEAGGRRFLRVPCIGAHPAFVASLVELARRR